MSYAATDPQFNRDLVKAMTALRDLRARSYREKWDPRALRCALKFAMKVDDYWAKGTITPRDEEAIEFLAEKYLEEAKQHGQETR